jgi:protein-disulfide isomerase
MILVRNDSHVIKATGAKVTVVEFGDFQCPACGVAYPVVKQIENDYKGKINFAFREYPLKVHPNGYSAALAAESAGGQGKFWEMFDKLYSKQSEWSDKNDPTDVFAGYAKDIGIDVDKFKQDLKNKKYDAKIQADVNDGNQVGINATPTFFINGKMYAGVLQYDDFKGKIDSELKK